MSVGKSKIERANQLGILQDDLENVVGSKRLGTKTALDFGQDLCVCRVAGIEQGRERCVLGTCRNQRWSGPERRMKILTKTVEEMTDKDPYAMSVDGLLQAQTTTNKIILKLVLRNTVEQRYFFHNLMN